MTAPSPAVSNGGEAIYQERRVPTSRGELYIRDYHGSAPAFVMLHGFPDNLRIFEKVAPLLASAGRRVVLFDFLGFGASDKPGKGYSFDQQVGDLLAVVDTASPPATGRRSPPPRQVRPKWVLAAAAASRPAPTSAWNRL